MANVSRINLPIAKSSKQNTGYCIVVLTNFRLKTTMTDSKLLNLNPIRSYTMHTVIFGLREFLLYNYVYVYTYKMRIKWLAFVSI